MTTWLLILLAWLARDAWAQTSPTCSQMPNLVCATAADTVTGPLTVNGAGPLLFEGATAGNGFETTLTVTDPTADRTFTLPDANSVAVQPQSCGGTDKVSAISAAGVVTCSTDQGGASIRWDQLTNPQAALSLTFDNAETTTFTWGAATGTTDFFTISDSVNNTGTGFLMRLYTAAGSTAAPFIALAQGSLGVQLRNDGLFQGIGGGVILANDLACTGCVAGSDLEPNQVNGTHLALASQATGDLMVYNGTDWVRLAVGTSSQVLAGGSTPTWSGITAAMLGAGDLANALTWNQACTASPCTLAAAPRTADTALVVHRGVVLRRITGTCDGSQTNEYTLSGTTLTFCGGAPATGADAAFVTYEL